MNNEIIANLHIMWYESKMLNETLDSLQSAIEHSSIPIHLKVCLNSQTYIEEPIEGNPDDMFMDFLHHSVFSQADSISFIEKTDEDPFYNIGDWRREQYYSEAKYTVWLESDCLLPHEFFYVLDLVEIDHPHLFSFASRKMWDDSWTEVEHADIQHLPHVNHDNNAEFPWNHHDYIDEETLFEINDRDDDIDIIKLSKPKIDGSLLCLSSGLPTPFIGPDMHFAREDYVAQLVFELYDIPQYHVTNRLKGHNYNHPLKRTNTESNREENIYKRYEKESWEAGIKFLNKLGWPHRKKINTLVVNNDG